MNGNDAPSNLVAVTGAGGFIGSHLTDALLGRGMSVLALDLFRKVPPNLADASSHPGFTYRACDVTSPRSVRKALATEIAAVIHAAAVVGVGSYIQRPVETIESIFLGTRTVLRECVERHRRFVQLSTSEVFGRNPVVPWSETSDRVLGDPSLGRWTYSSSKGLCEHLVNSMHEQHGVPTTIVRPFNVYGPRQRPAFVIPIAIHKALNGVPPVIYGDGRQTRCFTYVDDLIEALIKCLDQDAAIGQTFNIGNPQEWAISDAITRVLEACQSQLKPVHIDPQVEFGAGFDEILRRVPVVDRAHKLLGWSARIDLRQGLERTVAWARANPAWLSKDR